MKKFNQVIKVEVSVDSIAEKLKSTFNESFEHADMLTEAIIATSLESNKLSYIYNALNAFSNEIDFKIGQQVNCNEECWSYELQEDGKYISKRKTIGDAIIIDINVYSINKLNIRYECINAKGELITDTKWVSHLECNGLSNI